MKSKKGPPVHVIFQVQKGTILSTQLELSDKAGISWEVQGDNSLEAEIAAWMKAYIDGKQPQIPLPLAFEGIPPYSKQVLTALQNVTFGESLNYQELAVKTQNPGAARAVGNACARNPFPLLVPCHRVLAIGRRLGGFSQTPKIKSLLLDFEGVSYH